MWQCSTFISYDEYASQLLFDVLQLDSNINPIIKLNFFIL